MHSLERIYMNWSYTAIIYLEIFAMIIMSLIVKKNDLLSAEKKKQFISIFIIIIIASSSEWLALFLNGADPSTRLLHIIARILDHSLAPLIAVIFCAIITSEDKSKILILPMIIHAILEALSGYFGFIYYVDAGNLYHHGDCYWIYVAFYLACSLYFILEALQFGMRYQNNNGIILWLVLLHMISGVVIGMVRSDVHIAYLCLAIDTILVYIYYTEVIERTDGLTGLLNRHSYKETFQNHNDQAAVLFFDVDDFKSVNDQYGHLYGDECLKSVSKAILDVYGDKGSCYRIGGDEFCVILKKDLDQIELLNTQLTNKLASKRRSDIRLPFVSVGYAMFDPKMTDMESCIKEADKMMYEWKHNNKIKRQLLQKERTDEQG